MESIVVNRTIDILKKKNNLIGMKKIFTTISVLIFFFYNPAHSLIIKKGQTIGSDGKIYDGLTPSQEIQLKYRTEDGKKAGVIGTNFFIIIRDIVTTVPLALLLETSDKETRKLIIKDAVRANLKEVLKLESEIEEDDSSENSDNNLDDSPESENEIEDDLDDSSELENEIEDEIDDDLDDNQEFENEIEDEIDGLDRDLDDEIDDISRDLDDALEDAEDEIEDALEEAEDEIEDALEEAEDEIEDALEEAEDYEDDDDDDEDDD